jgi:hypothetical protein
MTLDVDLFANDEKVGRMNVVPYNTSQSGATYTYKFNIRPYDYMSNYVSAQHYTYYWLDDFVSTTDQINLNNPYPNSANVNFNYGYKYISGNTTVYENTATPDNPYYHYTDIPFCISDTGFTPSLYTNTGKYFDYVGGTLTKN